MSERSEIQTRIVQAVHGLAKVQPDLEFEIGMAAHLRDSFTRDALCELYARFSVSDGKFDVLMRKVIWRSLARQCGNGLSVGSGVGFKHIETFEIGQGVFLGAQAYIQGRFDGRCIIGDHVWIGPQSYFDARDLVIEEYVGWGPGAKVLGSVHTGLPIDVPIVETDLEIKPVKIEACADVGTGAIVLPGITIGRGSIVGAGAVVTKNVAPFSVVAGVPARFLCWRKGFSADDKHNLSK